VVEASRFRSVSVAAKYKLSVSVLDAVARDVEEREVIRAPSDEVLLNRLRDEMSWLVHDSLDIERTDLGLPENLRESPRIRLRCYQRVERRVCVG
jgi:hypothetical protein